ncbi:SPRY domain-containing protein 7 [Belonocnema kinseyi]|uniref:SPRY domain-containing protein 7 n=1 Tax=Belonocnema kinseyi TaxID=2817044 RepID=UPI00143D58A9|nr:SPRY domain-containing protein 7 [Belonocnema kinseyi]XP_033210880.1 SPRY domain-containing protein 7 [Belonocnema kinseyi]
MFCCLRNCFDGFGLSSNQIPRKELNPIALDTTHMGHEVVIVKNGSRVCGRGGALTNAPLAQSKSYFEVKVQQGGVWAVGLATRSTDLNTAIGGNDAESWALNCDGFIRHNQQELHNIQNLAQEGDIIGISFDHIELNFYLNGKPLDAPIMGLKGTVYPVLYVDDGAILDLILDEFFHAPPVGFEKIMLEQSLL